MLSMKEINRLPLTQLRHGYFELQQRVEQLEAAAKPLTGTVQVNIADGFVQIGDKVFDAKIGERKNGSKFLELGDRVTVQDGHHVPANRIEKAIAAGLLHERLF